MSDDVWTCDECRELVAPDVATVQGSLTHPEEVLCPNCVQEARV
jgi:ribosomal protein L37AE/L43A